MYAQRDPKSRVPSPPHLEDRGEQPRRPRPPGTPTPAGRGRAPDIRSAPPTSWASSPRARSWQRDGASYITEAHHPPPCPWQRPDGAAKPASNGAMPSRTSARTMSVAKGSLDATKAESAPTTYAEASRRAPLDHGDLPRSHAGDAASAATATLTASPSA